MAYFLYFMSHNSIWFQSIWDDDKTVQCNVMYVVIWRRLRTYNHAHFLFSFLSSSNKNYHHQQKWLTLVLLNLEKSCLCKQCRFRSAGFFRSQLASSEANWSGSALFAIKYANLTERKKKKKKKTEKFCITISDRLNEVPRADSPALKYFNVTHSYSSCWFFLWSFM